MKTMTEEKQIEERNGLVELLEDIDRDWDAYIDECLENEEQPQLSYEDFQADSILEAGYRKQSGNLVSVETVKKWLYEMAINNVGCVLNGDFSVACEEIISRLDGLQRFAEEMKGGAQE